MQHTSALIPSRLIDWSGILVRYLKSRIALNTLPCSQTVILWYVLAGSSFWMVVELRRLLLEY